MKFLLDTHILLWFLNGNEQLPKKERDLIIDSTNEIFYSSLAIFEIDFKHQKHPDDMPFAGEEIADYCKVMGFKTLDLRVSHALAVKKLKCIENAPEHKDPFDKLMLSQAIVENMLFMTHDQRLQEYLTPCVYKI